MSEFKIATVGDNCIDVYEGIGKAFPGGNPVNVAVYFTRLGGSASYTGVVGNDSYGKLMINSLKNKGVDTSHIKIVHGSTAITEVELVNGERRFGDYYEGVLSDFKLSGDDIDFICSHDMAVSGIWGKVENDLWKIRERGVKVAFDFATKLDDPMVNEILGNVDYAFFASDDGDTEDIRKWVKNVYRFKNQIIVVTLGEDGSIVYDGERFYKFGIVPCEVRDTMGAGDSYIAGFIKGVLENKSIEDCMKMGAENSSITLQYIGAW